MRSGGNFQDRHYPFLKILDQLSPFFLSMLLDIILVAGPSVAVVHYVRDRGVHFVEKAVIPNEIRIGYNEFLVAVINYFSLGCPMSSQIDFVEFLRYTSLLPSITLSFSVSQ